MSKRRQRILATARQILAEDGYDKLTIRTLASRSGVTAPTIYNLIGGKADVIDALIEELATRMNSGQLFQRGADPIETLELMVDRIAENLGQDPDYYRATFLAWEFQQHFENSEPSGVSDMSMRSMSTVIDAAQEAGLLRKNSDDKVLRLHIWNCYRIARHDWIHRHIDLNRFRYQALSGMLYYLLAVVKEEHRDRVLTALAKARKRLMQLDPLQ